jgi:hypothetical protein
MNDFTAEQRSKLGSLQHQSRGIAKRKMAKYQGDGNGVVVDGTGGSIKSMQDLVSQFEADGYDVSMVFTETSLDVAQERNAARKERSLLDKIVQKTTSQFKVIRMVLKKCLVIGLWRSILTT